MPRKSLPGAGSAPEARTRQDPETVTGLADPLVLTRAAGRPGYGPAGDGGRCSELPASGRSRPRPFSAGADGTDLRGNLYRPGPIPVVAIRLNCALNTSGAHALAGSLPGWGDGGRARTGTRPLGSCGSWRRERLLLACGPQRPDERSGASETRETKRRVACRVPAPRLSRSRARVGP